MQTTVFDFFPFLFLFARNTHEMSLLCMPFRSQPGWRGLSDVRYGNMTGSGNNNTANPIIRRYAAGFSFVRHFSPFRGVWAAAFNCHFYNFLRHFLFCCFPLAFVINKPSLISSAQCAQAHNHTQKAKCLVSDPSSAGRTMLKKKLVVKKRPQLLAPTSCASSTSPTDCLENRQQQLVPACPTTETTCLLRRTSEHCWLCNRRASCRPVVLGASKRRYRVKCRPESSVPKQGGPL